MKLIKRLILLSFVIFLLGNSKPNKALDYLYLERKIEIYTQTYYYSNIGHLKNSKTLGSVYKASYLCAKLFTKYPASSIEDRSIKFFCFPAQEVDFRRNHTEFNIPGVYLRGQHRYINHFSVDFGISGLNQINVKWTYEVAKILQMKQGNRRDIKLVNTFTEYGLNKSFICDLAKIQIPKSIGLKKIDISRIKEWNREYLNLREKGCTPLQIRSMLKSNYTELTQSDIDSLMIYRILVEMERMELGFKYDGYNHTLYNRLSKEVFING